MNCQECRASFERTLDVALKGGEQRKVSLHLSRCKDCRSYFDSRRQSHADAYRAMNAALADEHLPEGFTERFQAFLAQENAMPQKHWKYLGMFRKIAAVLAAMLFFAGLSYAAALVANELGRNESSRETDAGEASKVNESLSTASDPVSADAAVSETPLSTDALSGEKISRYDSAAEVMPQASFKNYNQQSGEDTMKRTKTVAAVLSAAMVSAPLAAADISVKSSVFDDVKIWYKGSAGNAIDSADSINNRTCLVKNLPDMADSTSIQHGGTYVWWGWRMSYKSLAVVCPYAGITFDSSSCMAVDSPVTTEGTEKVTINGTEMEQPKLNYRTGYLSFTNWLAGCESDCSNYTVFLRFRNESINPVPGNHNRVFSLGSKWTGDAGYPAGLDLRMVPTAQLSEYAYPKIFVGSVAKDCTEVRIKNGCWADCAIAVDGGAVTATFCWNDGPSNLIAKVSYSYPETGPLPAVPVGGVAIIGGEKGRESCSFTYGVPCDSSKWTYGFRGAFHQIAFWDRTLSDNEIREAMAAGAGRPNLISVGIEGNGIAEFATDGRQSSVANAGAWEYLNPTLTDENRSVEISFSCPANWAGMPQWLRLPMTADSGTGCLAVKLNGETIGPVAVSSGRVAKLYVPENMITSGANTLVLWLPFCQLNRRLLNLPGQLI